MIQADTLKEAQTIVNSSSCRTGDGILADSGAGHGGESAYWAIAFLRLGLSSRPHTASDALGKQLTARSARPYLATHHPHRVFGTVNTADPSPDAHTLQGSEARSSGRCHSMMRFLGIALYGFLQCQFTLVLSR